MLENGVLEKIKTDCLASQFLIMPIITGFFPMAQKFAAMNPAMPCSFIAVSAYSPCGVFWRFISLGGKQVGNTHFSIDIDC